VLTRSVVSIQEIKPNSNHTKQLRATIHTLHVGKGIETKPQFSA